MDDSAYVAELLAILTNEHPTGIDPDDPYGRADDGIDRYDGFGRDLVVTSLEVVESGHGDELRVGFAFPATATAAAVDLPFDREWRRLSGYDRPADFAPWVARRVESRAWLTLHPPRDEDRRAALASFPSRSEQWAALLQALARHGRTTEVEPGRLQVVLEFEEEPAQTVTVVVTPDQWEEVIAQETAGDVAMYIDELLGPMDDDERFVVHYKGRLERSIREELPPVRGRATERLMREVTENGGPDSGWFAYLPSE